MKKWDQIKKSSAMLSVIFLITGTLLTGCATDKKTYTTSTVQNPTSQTTVVETEKTVEKEDVDRGVLGSTFHVIGEVIAFPFEVLASAFRFIF